MSESFDYPRYLEAKAPIDERALNGRIFGRFLESMAERVARQAGGLQILEIGSGVGATFRRIVASGRFSVDHLKSYTFLDEHEPNQERCRTAVRACLESRHADVVCDDARRWRVCTAVGDVQLVWETAEAVGWLSDRPGRRFDAIVAQAVLDLLDLPTALPVLQAALRPGGSFYFPLTYDALTYFGPRIDPAVDAALMRFYDDSMDRRQGAGGSRSGRLVLEWLGAYFEGEVEAGSADWILVPGRYAPDGPEGYFLRQLLGFLGAEVARSGGAELRESFATWYTERLAQLEAGRLSFMGRHLDILALGR